jgi:hypothetical protein
MVSIVPPEAQLSLWSSSTTGPLPAGLAAASALRARHRLGQRLDLVDELRSRAAQAIASSSSHQRRAWRGVVVGAPPPPTGRRRGCRHSGSRRTRWRQRALRLHLAAARLQLAVRLVVGALAHHVRQHRLAAPGHHRLGLPGSAPARAAGAQAGLVHVDVRIGLVAGDHRALRRCVVEVGVHVQRDADGHRGRDGADAAQQLALAVLVAAA